MAAEAIAIRVFESALVESGYRILSREPYVFDGQPFGTWYRVARSLNPDVDKVAHWCILDDKADDEVEGWLAATAVVKVLAYQDP